MQASRTKNSIRNSVWGIIAKFINMFFQFVFRAIIIKKIGAAYIGLNGLFTSVLSVLNMTELGFGSAIIFMMYKPIAENNISEVRILLNLIKKAYRFVGLCVLAIGCCMYPFLNIIVKNDTGIEINVYLLYTMYLFRTVLSYWMSAYRSTIFTAYQRNDMLSKIGILCESVLYTLQILVLFTTKNYYLYLLVYSLMVIPQNILYYYFSKKMYPGIYCEGKPSNYHIDALKKKIIPLLGHRIGGTVIVSIDDIIIGSLLGVSVLTMYDNYYYIFHSIVSLLTVIRSSIMASIGNKIYSDTLDNTYTTFKKICFIWIGIVGWCASCLAGLYQPFIELWVGKVYVYDTFTMLSIVMYFFLWQFRFIGVTMKEAFGMWEPDRMKPYVGMITNFVFSIVLVKWTGSVLGALFPTMFVMLFIYFPWETWVLFTKCFKRSCKEYLILIMRCCLAAFCSILGSFFLGELIGTDSIFVFIVRTILCTIVSIVVYVIMCWNMTELQTSFDMVKKFLREKEIIKK